MDKERIRIGNIDLDVIGPTPEQVQRMHKAEERLNRLIADKIASSDQVENAEQAITIIALELMSTRLQEAQIDFHDNLEGRLASLDQRVRETIEKL